MAFSPTPEQQNILAAAKGTGHLMIKAYAGCAKTTSLRMIAEALPRETRGLALAFNVKIKKELERVFPPNFTVLTLNGMGHRAWGRATRSKLSLDDRKIGRLVTQWGKDHDVELDTEQWDETRMLVQAAMQRGIVPTAFPFRGLAPDTPDYWEDMADEEVGDTRMWQAARAILVQSIQEAFQGTVSFDDQIYCSALLGGVFERFPLVMVDESQDLSPLNHIQVQKAAERRLIVVGDPKQAIYAFRGADSSSMEKLRALRPEWVDLPLATTFRCPHVIVARQQEHAPGFCAWPTNRQGVVDRMSPEGWHWADVQAISQGAPTAILCRNVAPLLSLAFKLLKQKVPVVMLGRDIGKGLANLVKKIIPIDTTPTEICRLQIENWMKDEIQRAEAMDKPAKAEAIRDKAEALLAVLESAGIDDAAGLRRAIVDIFAQESGRATLATIHRSKGLEWPFVIHLDPWRVPSRQALAAEAMGNPVPMEQEKNLKYVCETRAQDTLLMAELEYFV